jgi:hypothetical protein
MASVEVSSAAQRTRNPVIDMRRLVRFVVTSEGRSIRTWTRPNARRLCQLVLVSAGRRIIRESACEALFPSLSPEAAARSLYKAQSTARKALKELGPEAAALLCADPAQIWADPAVALVVDLDTHEKALHAALQASPGQGRDVSLSGPASIGACHKMGQDRVPARTTRERTGLPTTRSPRSMPGTRSACARRARRRSGLCAPRSGQACPRWA